MYRYYEADRNALLSLGLLSSNVHSVLSRVASERSANPEQRRIVKNAIDLTENIRKGQIAKPEGEDYLALPSPSAAKARTFAIRAWRNVASSLQDGQRGPANFDRIMQEYLELFRQIEETGSWPREKDETAEQARSFFRTLSQVIVDNLNGLVEDENPLGASHQTA